MKLVIPWVDVSGYTASSWRAFAARPRVELFVLVPDLRRGVQSGVVNQAFDAEALLTGVPHRFLSEPEYRDAELIAREVIAQKPDVIYLPGWATPQYTGLTAAELRGIRFLMGSDTGWTGSLRQIAGRWAKRSFFSRIDGVIVAGEGAFRLARWLGFPEGRIMRGMAGVDMAPLLAAYDARGRLPEWPRKFVYVGRYVHDKGIDVLVDAYARYRRHALARGREPWSLSTCGRGPQASLIQGQPGATDLGFVQPRDLPGVLASHGAFVIASRQEPWGVVLVEAAASGLPVLSTEACGASIDVVRSYYNGMIVPTGDAAALADAMAWVDESHADLPAIGGRGRDLGGAYSAEMWGARMEAMCRRVLAGAR